MEYQDSLWQTAEILKCALPQFSLASDFAVFFQMKEMEIGIRKYLKYP